MEAASAVVGDGVTGYSWGKASDSVTCVVTIVSGCTSCFAWLVMVGVEVADHPIVVVVVAVVGSLVNNRRLTCSDESLQ